MQPVYLIVCQGFLALALGFTSSIWFVFLLFEGEIFTATRSQEKTDRVSLWLVFGALFATTVTLGIYVFTQIKHSQYAEGLLVPESGYAALKQAVVDHHGNGPSSGRHD